MSDFVTHTNENYPLDTISWITPRLAVTDMYGALCARAEIDCFVINTAEEVETPCDYKLPINPYDGGEAVRDALDILADVIHGQLDNPDNEPVVVHCFAGMERSVLTCVWYLHKYHNRSIDEAYQIVRNARPIVLDRRNWVN